MEQKKRIQVQIIYETFNVIAFPLGLRNSAFQPTLYMVYLKVVFIEQILSPSYPR